jgi:LPXTG-site transpeptidase (sortase) family protein
MRVPKLTLPKSKNKRLVIVVCSVILTGTIAWLIVNSQNKVEAPAETLTYSTDKPDENKPDKNTYKWQGAPDEPKYISLPTIGAEGFVQRVGVDQNKQVAVPSNIHIAGWFVDSVKPGQNGLSIIDGHVTGWTTDGIFKNLGQLKSGDTYTVKLGNGTIKKYKVKEVITRPAVKSASPLFSQDPKVKSQLNLITCGGKFDQKTNQYENRIIATSELIN